MKQLFKILAIFVILASAVLVPATGLYPPSQEAKASSAITSFSYRKLMVFNTSATGANVTSSQTNFPIYIHINSSSWSNTTENANFFGAYNISGKRIQIFDSDQTTNLDYGVVYYSSTGNTSTNEAIYCVEVPSVAGDSITDSIWVAYGNDPNSSNQDNPTGVWNSAYKTVLFMDESGATLYDSTSNAKDATKKAAGEPAQTTGQVYNGQLYDGSNDYATFSNGTLNPTTNSFSLSAWYTIGSGVDGSFLEMFRAYGSAPTNTIAIYRNADNNFVLLVRDGDGDAVSATSADQYKENSTLCHIFGVYNNSTQTATLYINGSQVGTGTNTNVGSVNTDSCQALGAWYLGSISCYFKGKIDEFRFSIDTTAKTADWAKLEYYAGKKTNWIGDAWLTWPLFQVTTNAASSIKSTSAELNGNVTLCPTDFVAFWWDTTSQDLPTEMAAGDWANYYAWEETNTEGETFSYTTAVGNLTVETCYYFVAGGNSTSGTFDCGSVLWFCTMSEDEHDFGVILHNSYADTAITHFYLKNCGDGNISVTISATSMVSTSSSWPLANSADATHYALKAGLDDDDDTFDVTVTTVGATLEDNLGNGTYIEFGLRCYAPTVTWTDKEPKSGNVTLTLESL